MPKDVSHNVEVVVPLTAPILFEENLRPSWEATIASIVRLSHQTSFSYDDGAVRSEAVEIARIDTPVAVRRAISERRAFRDHTALRFSAVVKCERGQVQDAGGRPVSRRDEAEVLKYCAEDSLYSHVRSLLLAATISSPGAVSLHDAFIRRGRTIARHERTSPSVIVDAVEYATSLGWPIPVAVPTVQTAWTWMGSVEGLGDGYAQGRIGRAVGALSHLMFGAERSEMMDLVWAMVGIESLFSDGRSGSTHQVRTGAVQLLGEPQRHKSKLREMYDFRSKFLHGNADFLLAGGDATDRFAEEAYDVTRYSAALLIACLQTLAVRGVVGLDVSYALRFAMVVP